MKTLSFTRAGLGLSSLGLSSLGLSGVWLSGLGAAALPLCLSLPALAADPAGQPGGLIEAVVVTARQRAEDPQRVPVSLSIIGEQRLERAQIDGITGLAAHAPGLAVSDPFGRFNPAPAMRGLTQPGTGDEPSVGFFLDGVYVTGRSSINLFLNDLERVEVLKGPQNALFGRNSFGGAVNLITRKPGDAVEGYLEGTLGSKDLRAVQAGVAGPLVPGKLAARVSLSVKDAGGFYDNAAGTDPEIGSEKSSAGAVTLRATPTDRLEALLRVSYAEDRDGQPKGYYLATNCQPRLVGGLPTGAFSQYCGEIPQSSGPFAANAEATGFTRDAWRTALTVRYELDAVTLTGISAANWETNEFNRDDDYSAALIARAGQQTVRKDFSQEIRLTSADRGQALTWLAGASWYRFDNETERRNQLYYLGQTTPGGARTAAVTDSWAAYGSASLRLPLDLTATADLRWQRDDKSFASSALDAQGRPIVLADDWTMLTPRLSLAWQALDSVMAYASVAKGAKSGGFNEMASIFDDERSFDPERNWTYELGSKTSWLDGRLTANATLFWVEWKNQQVVAASAAGSVNNFYTNNAGRSRSKGLELELQARPLDGLTLGAGYTLTDARFVDYDDPDYRDIPAFAPDGRIDGKVLPRQSRHQLAASAEYQAPLPGGASGLDGFAGGEWLWQSRQYTENSNLSWIGDIHTVNLWTGIDTGRLRLTLRVKNLLDDRTPPVAVRFSQPTLAGYQRAWLATPGDGRTWSVSARASF